MPKAKPFSLANRPAEIFADLEMVATKHKKFATPGFSLEQAYRVYYSAISRNPMLLQCTNASITKCLLDAASLGLFIGDTLGQCYAVPFKNSKLKPPLNYEAVFIMGYQGMIELVRRSGEVESMSAELVFENDSFDIQMGTTQNITHIPAGFSKADWADKEKMKRGRGEPVLGYCITSFRDGGHHMTVMSISEIDAFEKRSKAGGTGPWKTDRNAMRLKTLVRREYKFCPKSPAMMKATELEDRIEIEGPTAPIAVVAEAVITDVPRETKSERIADAMTEDKPKTTEPKAEEPLPDMTNVDTETGEIKTEDDNVDLQSAKDVIAGALKGLTRAQANMLDHSFCKKHKITAWGMCEDAHALADFYESIDAVMSATKEADPVT